MWRHSAELSVNIVTCVFTCTSEESTNIQTGTQSSDEGRLRKKNTFPRDKGFLFTFRQYLVYCICKLMVDHVWANATSKWDSWKYAGIPQLQVTQKDLVPQAHSLTYTHTGRLFKRIMQRQLLHLIWSLPRRIGVVITGKADSSSYETLWTEKEKGHHKRSWYAPIPFGH